MPSFVDLLPGHVASGSLLVDRSVVSVAEGAYAVSRPPRSVVREIGAGTIPAVEPGRRLDVDPIGRNCPRSGEQRPLLPVFRKQLPAFGRTTPVTSGIPEATARVRANNARYFHRGWLSGLRLRLSRLGEPPPDPAHAIRAGHRYLHCYRLEIGLAHRI
jgi:hypothetical protein